MSDKYKYVSVCVSCIVKNSMTTGSLPLTCQHLKFLPCLALKPHCVENMLDHMQATFNNTDKRIPLDSKYIDRDYYLRMHGTFIELSEAGQPLYDISY